MKDKNEDTHTQTEEEEGEEEEDEDDDDDGYEGLVVKNCEGSVKKVICGFSLGGG